jgi:hypothetical protein
MMTGWVFFELLTELLNRLLESIISTLKVLVECSKTQVNFSPCSTSHYCILFTFSALPCLHHTFIRRMSGHCLGAFVNENLSLFPVKCSVSRYFSYLLSLSLFICFIGCSWLFRCGETTSLNCGQQRAYFASPSWYMSMELHDGMISRKERSPDSSTRVLWQLYQQNYLVAKEDKRGEEMRILLMKYLFSYS